MTKIDVMFSSETDDWETPQALFDELDAEFHFTLDPCADDKNHKCARYFTKEQDGLKQTWDGVVFCNPPYGRKIGQWVEKAYKSARGGCIVVMLIPARTDTIYFHRYIYHHAQIRFIKGRLRFGGSKNNAPFPSMIAIFGQ